MSENMEFTFGTGKAGYIMYLNTFFKELLSEEELLELSKKWKEELPHGNYVISKEGVEYYGKGKLWIKKYYG